MPKKKYSIEQIKADYIYNNLTTKELMNKYKLTERTIRKYISNGKWKNEKELYYKTIADSVKEQTKEQLIKELSENEKKHIKNITKTIDILSDIVNDDIQFYRYNTSPIERTMGKQEYISEKADLQSIKGYISSLKDIQTLLNELLELNNTDSEMIVKFIGCNDNEIENYSK